MQLFAAAEFIFICAMSITLWITEIHSYLQQNTQLFTTKYTRA